uniref:Anaphase promoting complex subunit 4 n=1 Tax=Oncorhynchus tshawytscha TaxID=74940 RepID=A0A8C8HGX0_ONCTS
MPTFRQVGEKQFPNLVLCMAWFPKRDLIALAHTAVYYGSHLCLPPNENTGKEITALAWRPDASGTLKLVVLCDAEKAEILHLFPVENPMPWMEVLEESSVLYSFYTSEDESNLFLPKLPTLPKRQPVCTRIRFLITNPPSCSEDDASFTCFIMEDSVNTQSHGICHILCLSGDLKSLFIIPEIRSADNDPEICYIQLDTGLLSHCLPEVTRMAHKFTHISTLLQVIPASPSLTRMCEVWEDILMQMDLRLTKFVQVTVCLSPFSNNDSTPKRHDPNQFLLCILPRLWKGTDPYEPVLTGFVAIDLSDVLSHSIDNDASGVSSDCVYSCQDARFDDDETLTLQSSEEEEIRGRVLAQLPLGSALSCEEEFHWTPVLVLDQQSGAIPAHGVVLENQWRDMKAQFGAVNWIRKVACVLSSNLRHLRVFEMDVEDEERPELQNASSDQDGLEETLASQGEAEEGETKGQGWGQSAEQRLECGEALILLAAPHLGNITIDYPILWR